MKEASLSIVEDVKNGRYLMVRNYRGINKGCLNFPGGKKEPGEDMLTCVIRETFEETGITIKNPLKVGYVEFPTMDFYVHVYKSTEFSGELKSRVGETEVFWQDKNHIPFEEMRAADKDFIPEILAGKYVKRRYFYTPDFQVERVEDITD